MEHGAKTYPKQMCFYISVTHANPAWPKCPSHGGFGKHFFALLCGFFSSWWFQTHFKNISQIGSSPQIGVNI